MDVARLNYSHGTLEEHAETVTGCGTPPVGWDGRWRSCRTCPVRSCASGRWPTDLVELTPGELLTFVCGDGDQPGDGHQMSVSWPGLADAVEPDSILYLADGAVRLRVAGVRSRGMRGATPRSRSGAPVASRQGLNIPGPWRGLPAVPERGPRTCCVTASRSASTWSRCRSCGPPRTSNTVRQHTRLPLVAKMEKPQAVERAAEILRAADCVMVARGDLGIELPIARGADRPEAAAGAGGLAGPPLDHGDADARLDGRLLAARPARRSPTSPTRSSTAPTR